MFFLVWEESTALPGAIAVTKSTVPGFKEKGGKPCWKNSLHTFSLQCLLSSQGLQGLQMSAHLRAI